MLMYDHEVVHDIIDDILVLTLKQHIEDEPDEIRGVIDVIEHLDDEVEVVDIAVHDELVVVDNDTLDEHLIFDEVEVVELDEFEVLELQVNDELDDLEDL